MKLKKLFSLGLVLIVLIFSQYSKLLAQSASRFEISIKPASDIFVDINQKVKCEFSAVWSGITPDRLTLAVVNSQLFFSWDQEWRNDRQVTNHIYNDFYITTFLDSLDHWQLRTGMYELVFQISAFVGREIITTNTTVRVIIRPAILSTHKVSRGTQNVIEWVDSDSLQFSIIDPHHPGATQTTTSRSSGLMKATIPTIKTTKFDGLTPELSYDYYIESQTQDRQTDTSKTVTVKQDGEPPAPVQNLTSHSAAGGHIRLTWSYDSATNSDLRGFYIYRREGIKELQLIDSILVKEDPVQYTFLDGMENGLEAGRYYSYRVSAYDTVFNISTGELTVPQLVDNTAPAKPYFIWGTDSGYVWRDENPTQEIKDQKYKYAYYNKGKTNQVYVVNPNTVSTADITESTYILLQWVRNYSHFFDALDTSLVSDKNHFSSGWLWIGGLEDTSRYLTYSFDFSNNGAVTDEEIHGHFYKYRIKLKDDAGNESEWSREHQIFSDMNYVGAIQDLFPPEPVFVLKSVVELLSDHNGGFVNLQWQARPDLVSGSSHFNIYRRFASDSVVFIGTVPYDPLCETYVYHDPLANFLPDSIVDHDCAEYWILPQDFVGNHELPINVPPIIVNCKIRPQLSPVADKTIYNQTLVLRLQYQSTLPVDKIIFYTDSPKDPKLREMVISPPRPVQLNEILVFPISEFPQLRVPHDSQVTVFTFAVFANGDMSLKSNLLTFTRDTILPAIPDWKVQNVDSIQCNPISDTCKNFPQINIFSLDNDIDSLYIMRAKNIAKNSQFGSSSSSAEQYSGSEPDSVVVALVSPFKLPICWIDSSAVQLLDYGYYLVMVDWAGNKDTSETKRGYGVQKPNFEILNYDYLNEKLSYKLVYPKRLYDSSAVYEIRVSNVYFNPSAIDITTKPDADFLGIKRGPKNSGSDPDDIDFADSNVIITGTLSCIKPQDDVKFHLYTTLRSVDNKRHTRAEYAFFALSLKQPTLKLIDQPGNGSVWIDTLFAIDQSQNVKPDTFKVFRRFANSTGTLTKSVPFMDGFSFSDSAKISYTCIPGLKLSDRSSNVYWSEADSSEPVTVIDTKRGYIPYLHFPEDDSLHYVAMYNTVGFDSVYFNSEDLKICWNWDSTRVDSLNQNPAYVDSIFVRVTNGKNSRWQMDNTITGEAKIKSGQFTISEISKLFKLNFPDNGDSLYVTLTAKDTYGNGGDVWLDTALAIIDKQPPALPIIKKDSLGAAWTGETDKISIVLAWKLLEDRESGIADSFHVELNNIKGTKVSLTLSTNNPCFVNDQYYWKPMKKASIADTLWIINVLIDNLLIEDPAPWIRVTYYDKLQNKRLINFEELVKPVVHTFNLVKSDESQDGIKYISLKWDSVVSDQFNYYLVNYSNKKDSLGQRTHDYDITDSNSWSICAEELTTEYYFHVCAIFKNSSASNWSNIEPTDNSTIMIFSGVDDKTMIPSEFNIYQNFPNPFNLSTTIDYDLPILDDIEIIVFDAVGREVKKLITGEQNAGRHRINWDGSDNNLSIVATGIYFIVFQTTDHRFVKKCLLMK